MGLGNGNPKSGNKGSNYAYELKQVLTLSELLSSVKRHGLTALATESTLISVLNAIVASDQDIEILLVRDTVTLIVYQQITDYSTGIPIVSYKDVNGALFVPINPMEYLDPSAVLNLMLTELLNLNAGGPLATEATVAFLYDAVGYDGIVHGLSPGGSRALGSDGTKDQQLLTDTNGRLQVDVITGGSAGGATEATQLLVDTSTSTLATPVTGLGMTLFTGVSQSGTISAGQRSISILNAGANAASVAGGVNNLLPGVEITWEAGGIRDTLGSLTWDGTVNGGTTLIISTVG